MLDLPGVGRSLHSKLMEIGVTTCGDLKQIPLHDLQSKFGSRTGQSLFNHCRGIDDRQLKTSHERQSVSAEINYGIRFTEVMITLEYVVITISMLSIIEMLMEIDFCCVLYHSLKISYNGSL